MEFLEREEHYEGQRGNPGEDGGPTRQLPGQELKASPSVNNK